VCKKFFQVLFSARSMTPPFLFFERHDRSLAHTHTLPLSKTFLALKNVWSRPKGRRRQGRRQTDALSTAAAATVVFLVDLDEFRLDRLGIVVVAALSGRGQGAAIAWQRVFVCRLDADPGQGTRLP
jgi:hypothetical protein